MTLSRINITFLRGKTVQECGYEDCTREAWVKFEFDGETYFRCAIHEGRLHRRLVREAYGIDENNAKGGA